MDKTRWGKIRDIFSHLSEQSPSFRANYLDMVCEHDPDLRTQVETMLESHDQLASGEARMQQSAFDSHQELIGTRIGDYEITSIIGNGGMSTVYRATHADLGEVAIKSLPHYALDVPAARARLEQEAELLNALSHPALCSIHELLQTHDQLAIVMELVDGNSLDNAMEDKLLTFCQAINIAMDLAKVLTITHAKGIIHRDIKPSNILLQTSGVTRLIDFGIAHFSDARLTYTGELLGSPAYMSPEQWSGQAVDGRTDIWALGALLYYMCCGQPAFQGSSIAEYAKAICDGHTQPWPGDLLNSEPEVRARKLVMSMLEKKPEDRPVSMTAVLDALKSIRE